MTGDKKEELALSEEQEAQPLRIDEASDEQELSAPRRAKRNSAPTDSEDDEDDETWTNQPPSVKEVSHAAEAEEGDSEEHEDEVEQTRTSRRVIQNGRDVLCEELPERAQRAALRLKPYLTGVLVIEFTNSGERFVFDWRDETPKTHPIGREVAVSISGEVAGSVSNDKVQADAIVALSEQHVMSIRAGDLNPQIGMLTEKIRVKGKVSSAVYLFNLIAPRSRN
jgi:hypothetical protein